MYPKAAVALGDLKNAALYFDHVVPVNLTAELMAKDQESWQQLLLRGAAALLPPDLADRPQFGERLISVNQRVLHIVLKMGIRKFGWEPRITGLTAQEYDSAEDDCVQAYFDFLDEFDLNGWPLAAVGTPGSADMLSDTSEQGLVPLLTLSRIPLIDVSRASWDHILELRRDVSAREKLRRLRLFAFENYSDKPRTFIEDDILSRVEAYDTARKQLGLEHFHGAISIVLNSKLAASAFAGTLVAGLFGGPVSAIVAATAGATLELGHFALELHKQKLEFQALARNNPVSYIVYANEQLATDGDS